MGSARKMRNLLNNSNQTFFIQLILWTIANGISMVSCWFLIAAILLDKKVRSREFNVYLLFSILPEAIYSPIVFASNLANMIPDEGNPKACSIIGSVSAYWFTANMWMGALVFRELYKLLLSVKKFERFHPSTKKIVKQSTAVHLYAVFFAIIPLIDVSYIPKSTPNTGCEPIPVNATQHVFFWMFFCPATILIPGLFAVFICFKIWKEELLPESGAKRALLFYFARLIILIFTLTVAILVAFSYEGWTQAVAFIFFNLTGFIQMILALFKNDVKLACYKLINCRCCENEDIQESAQNSSDEDNQSVKRSSTYGFGFDRLSYIIFGKFSRASTSTVEKASVFEEDEATSSTDCKGGSQCGKKLSNKSGENDVEAALEDVTVA